MSLRTVIGKFTKNLFRIIIDIDLNAEEALTELLQICNSIHHMVMSGGLCYSNDVRSSDKDERQKRIFDEVASVDEQLAENQKVFDALNSEIDKGKRMSSVEPFAKKIQRIMGDAIPDWMPRGTWHENEYKHICLNLEDNFIDGKYPDQCNVKGDLYKKDIKYHQYASHLNSSQVMCISFFKKFFEKSEYEEILLEVLRMAGIDILPDVEIKNGIFEYEPDQSERTNFDFYLVLTDGRKISMEIKYTETEFGGISQNDKDSDKYRNKWKNIYQAMVMVSPYIDCNENNFYENYQINRNIVFAKEGDVVIFLTPKANDAVGILEGRKYIESLGNSNICNLYWEEIVEELLKLVKDLPELSTYYTKFYNKYIRIFNLQ